MSLTRALFSRRSLAAEAPRPALPLPDNRSEWVVGKTYTKNGKTGVWNGTNFEVQ